MQSLMMNATRKIEEQNWMRAEETQTVMHVLNKGSREPKALFVGGCVRNALLNCIVDDVDIVTQWTPEEVTEKLKAADIKVIPTGIDHGTVTAILNKQSFEITTLRKDVETFGRHAVVAFTADWAEDSQRRDFTMNTLLCDLDGNIYDPTGQGLSDLDARHVVFVGDPAIRIAEDYLRILRFFRFHLYYGDGEADAAALKACQNAASHISELSRERITQEFLKILTADNPVPVLELMFDHDILKTIFCKNNISSPMSGLPVSSLMCELCRIQNQYNAKNIVTRLIVLAGFEESHLSVFKKFILLSNKQKKTFFAILKARSETDIKILIYRYGADIAAQVVMLSGKDVEISMQLIKNWSVPLFPLSGDDVKAAGITEGPEIGRILSEIESWWIDQDFQPDRALCLTKLSGA